MASGGEERHKEEKLMSKVVEWLLLKSQMAQPRTLVEGRDQIPSSTYRGGRIPNDIDGDRSNFAGINFRVIFPICKVLYGFLPQIQGSRGLFLL